MSKLNAQSGRQQLERRRVGQSEGMQVYYYGHVILCTAPYYRNDNLLQDASKSQPSADQDETLQHDAAHINTSSDMQSVSARC